MGHSNFLYNKGWSIIIQINNSWILSFCCWCYFSLRYYQSWVF